MFSLFDFVMKIDCIYDLRCCRPITPIGEPTVGPTDNPIDGSTVEPTEELADESTEESTDKPSGEPTEESTNVAVSVTAVLVVLIALCGSTAFYLWMKRRRRAVHEEAIVVVQAAKVPESVQMAPSGSVDVHPPVPSTVIVYAIEIGAEAVDEPEALPTDWRTWNAEQVLEFIISIVPDDALEKYRESIREEVIESEYDGLALELVTLEHIKEMGIRNITVANTVYDAVLALREGPQNEGMGQNGGTADAGSV